MFARQIAVMKGQAWNVVETLKTPDHGPLELTRRAKVCVWDDLVDVPVAVPMRVTSAEMMREAELRRSIDEGDIGQANTSAAPTHRVDEDLLGFASPPADMPHPGRFELALSPTSEGAQSPDEMSMSGSGILASSAPLGNKEAASQRPRFSGQSHRESYHGTRALNMYSPARQQSQQQQQRRYSFATAAGRRNSGSIAQHLYGSRRSMEEYDEEDDVEEGDLGYAAAEGMEGNQRKVIVERLEPVKARNPVFTCW